MEAWTESIENSESIATSIRHLRIPESGILLPLLVNSIIMTTVWVLLVFLLSTPISAMDGLDQWRR